VALDDQAVRLDPGIGDERLDEGGEPVGIDPLRGGAAGR
jgi:hypothetical protein